MAQLTPKSLTLSECNCALRSALSPGGTRYANGQSRRTRKIAHRRSAPQQIALRAKIILLADKGSNNREIGRELSISRYMARRWRNRWLESRCAIASSN